MKPGGGERRIGENITPEQQFQQLTPEEQYDQIASRSLSREERKELLETLPKEQIDAIREVRDRRKRGESGASSRKISRESSEEPSRVPEDLVTTRRAFLAGVGGAALVAAGMKAHEAFSKPAPKEDDMFDGLETPETDTNVGEKEKFPTVREALAYVDKKRFDGAEGDEGRILNDPDTVGGHLKAVEAGEREGNERTKYWVAYNKDLLTNPEFKDHLSKEKFDGLETADDYGAFFEHITRTTLSVAAAELVAMEHPDFSGDSVKDAEEKLARILSEADDPVEKAKEYSNWLQGHYSDGKTKYEFVDIENKEYWNMGIETRDGQHSIFTMVSPEEILHNEKGQLVKITTTLGSGDKVIRYMNPVCTNLMRDVYYNDNPNPVLIDQPNRDPRDPGGPDNPPNNPNDPDEPGGPKPKDSENLNRIDTNAHQDIAEDIGSKEVRTTHTSTDGQPVTQAPSSSAYEGTSPQIVENTPSEAAEPVTPSSPQNDYSQDRGAANSGYSPVQPDSTPPLAEVSNPPATASDAADVLSDLGIN